MARTIALVLLCTALLQVAWGHVANFPRRGKIPDQLAGAYDSDACEKLANDLDLVENTLKNGWTTVEGTINGFIPLIADFPKCIVLDPFQTMKCFIQDGVNLKDQIDTANTIFQMMKETMDELWQTVHADLKACTGKA